MFDYHLKIRNLYLTEKLNKDDRRDDAFNKLAYAQRGKPEIAMLDVQFANGGGVLNFVVEHVGDLTHRMSEKFSHFHGQYDIMHDKVLKTYKMLTQGYGFEKEHKENIANNANARNISIEEQEKRVEKALKKYAEEHKKLVVYNDAQSLAKDAAVFLGLQKFDLAASKLKKLLDLMENKEKWEEHAGKFNPRYRGTRW